jgi:hypothetical protein
MSYYLRLKMVLPAALAGTPALAHTSQLMAVAVAPVECKQPQLQVVAVVVELLLLVLITTRHWLIPADFPSIMVQQTPVVQASVDKAEQDPLQLQLSHLLLPVLNMVEAVVPGNQLPRRVLVLVVVAFGAEQEVVQVVAIVLCQQHWQQVLADPQDKDRLCAVVAEQLGPVDHLQMDNQAQTVLIIQVAKAVVVGDPLLQHSTPEQAAAEEVAVVVVAAVAVAAPLAMLAAQVVTDTAWLSVGNFISPKKLQINNTIIIL